MQQGTLTPACLPVQALAEQLKEVADVVVPLTAAAEDGELRAALQQAGVPFVGPPSDAAAAAADRGRHAPAHLHYTLFASDTCLLCAHAGLSARRLLLSSSARDFTMLT
jgi:hypothetical protein